MLNIQAFHKSYTARDQCTQGKRSKQLFFIIIIIWIIKSKVTVSRSIGLSTRRKCRSRARSDLSGCWARLTTESRRKLMVARQTSKHIGDSKNFNNQNNPLCRLRGGHRLLEQWQTVTF